MRAAISGGAHHRRMRQRVVSSLWLWLLWGPSFAASVHLACTTPMSVAAPAHRRRLNILSSLHEGNHFSCSRIPSAPGRHGFALQRIASSDDVFASCPCRILRRADDVYEVRTRSARPKSPSCTLHPDSAPFRKARASCPLEMPLNSAAVLASPLLRLKPPPPTRWGSLSACAPGESWRGLGP